MSTTRSLRSLKASACIFGICLLASPVAGAKTTIKIMTHSYPDWLKQEKIIATNFMKTHPSIKVEVMPYDSTNVQDKYLTMVSAGVQPDVILTNDLPAAEFGERKLLVNLETYSSQFNGLKDLAKEAIDGARGEAGKSSKAMWWLPTSLGITNQFSALNKTMALRAGLDPSKPPKSWDEMLSWARKLTIKGGDGKVTQWGVDGFSTDAHWWGSAYIFTAYDGEHHWYDLKEKKAYFNNPTTLKVIDSWVDLVKSGVAPTYPGPFANKKSAMSLVGHSGAYRDWIKKMPEVIPIPIPGATWRASLNYGYAISRNIPKARQQAAWEFLKYRVTRDAFRVQWQLSKWDPASSKEANKDAEISRLLHQDKLFEFGYDYIDQCKLAPFDRRKNDQIFPTFVAQLNKALEGKLSSKQAMDTVQTKAMQIISSIKR